MKYLKMLGLAAVAAMALMAFAAGTASATTLDNGKGEHLSIGTAIDASLTESAELLDTNNNPLDTCSTGTIEGVTTTTGAANETVKGTVATADLTWGGCTTTTDTTAGGELEIHWISGGRNGTLTGNTFSVTVAIFGVSCSYGLSTTDTNVHVGTLNGSDTAPTMAINTIVVKTAGGFLCPGSARWKANYRVTTPTGLTVTE